MNVFTYYYLRIKEWFKKMFHFETQSKKPKFTSRKIRSTQDIAPWLIYHTGKHGKEMVEVTKYCKHTNRATLHVVGRPHVFFRRKLTNPCISWY